MEPVYVMNGKICDVRVWKGKALTDDEVEQLYNGIDISSGLVGYWKFDGTYETSYLKDYSGYGNDGIVINATWNQTGGKIGGAYEFDGVDDYINVGSSSVFNFQRTDKFSISYWINSNGSNVDIVNKRDGGNTWDGWSIGISNNNNTNFILASGGTPKYYVYTADPPKEFLEMTENLRLTNKHTDLN